MTIEILEDPLTVEMIFKISQGADFVKLTVEQAQELRDWLLANATVTVAKEQPRKENR